jgi:chromosomal replication initiator protein
MGSGATITEKLELKFRGRLLGYFSANELLELKTVILDSLTKRNHKYVGRYEVISAVSQYFCITNAALLSHNRDHHLVIARQAAMVLLREYGLSLQAVGDMLDRDHGTVIHAIKAVQERCETDPHFERAMKALREIVSHETTTPTKTEGPLPA